MTGLIAARKLINTEHEVLLVEYDGFLGGVLKNSNKVDKINGKKVFDWVNETEKLIANSKNIKILKELDQWLEYELPNNLLGIIWKGKFRGQKQKWFVVRFTGEENEINLKTEYPEFIEWKWVEMDELPKIIVNFKKKFTKKYF